MSGIDMWIVLGMMALLFLRHVNVYKDPNKINYAPMVLGLGGAGTILHWILYYEEGSGSLLMKESLLVLGVGIILSAFMSVMSQTAAAANRSEEQNRLSSMKEQMQRIDASVMLFAERLEKVAQMENFTQSELQSAFKEEIEALNVVQANQKLFVTKLETLLSRQQSAIEKFEEFTLTDLPGLDNVVHRHIDILRIAEQDHFNHLKTMFRQYGEEHKDLEGQFDSLREMIERIQGERLSDATLAAVRNELDRIVREFSHQLQSLGSKSESIVTSLLENDAILKGSREQSELIMQQMVLSSKQMREITAQSKELSDSLKPLSKMFTAAEALHGEFASAKSALGELIVTLESYERHEYRSLRETLERVSAEAVAQIQLLNQSLEKYSRPETIAPTNVQELASKVKLRSSYAPENPQ